MSNTDGEDTATKKWLNKFGLHSRKNHGLNAHLKPRLYFVKYEDAEQAIDALTKQLADQMQDYHGKIAKLINEKADLHDRLKQQEEVIRELIPIAERAIYYDKGVFEYTNDPSDKMEIEENQAIIEKSKSLTTKDK